MQIATSHAIWPEGRQMKIKTGILGLLILALLVMAPTACAQMTVGENTKLNAGGLFTMGYSGDYGDQVPSSHGVDLGFNGTINGSYYNPNFLNFSITPYYNRSQANSDYQSITGASGVTGTANFFAGSHFPGTISYHHDDNSTGTFGLTGQPDFTTHGSGQGFGIGWSALLPNMPTLSVGYSQGSGGGSIYGTNQETSSSNRTFNLHSNYQMAGFRLNGFFDHTSFESKFPEFLTGGEESSSNTSGHDFGFGATHSLPLNGSFYANYTRTTSGSEYVSDVGQNANNSHYTDSLENAGASFHPTQKFGFFVNESFVDDLSGYLTQSLGVGAQPVNLGSGSHSYSTGGGASYQFTNFLTGTAQATHYQQYYFGQSYSGTFISGNVNYLKKLWDMFSFSGGLIESNNAKGDNAIGFIANVNFSRHFGAWQTSANFNYAQNVQSALVTYTNSYYNYSANVRRNLPFGLRWIAAFNGSHSGLTNQPGSSNHSEGYSSSIGTRRLNVTGNYSQANGVSLLGAGGLQGVPPTPGVNDYIFFNGSSYGGGISGTPIRRLVLSATFNRGISNTLGGTTPSRNNTEIFNAQMQYHLRRIGLQAGYTKFTQGISAAGAPPATSNAFFVGFSRWFDFF